jgi:hypothetical protein
MQLRLLGEQTEKNQRERVFLTYGYVLVGTEEKRTGKNELHLGGTAAYLSLKRKGNNMISPCQEILLKR